MTSPTRPILDRIRSRLGLPNPPIHSHRRPHRPIYPSPRRSAREKAILAQMQRQLKEKMKEAPAPPPKTFGTGLESPNIYGALPLSKERVAEIQEEIAAEEAARAKEVPIKTFNTGKQQFMGIGLTDPKIKNATAQWESEQRALLQSSYASPIANASPKSSPILMGHTLRPLRPSS